MKAIYSVFFSLCIGLLVPTISSANSKTVGTVVKISGSATILVNGKSSAAGPKPRVSYEGRYYTEKKVRRGTKVRPGHIIRTTPQSSVKIIFSNGDHFLVGPSTSYLYSYRANKKGKDKKPTIDIYYGKLRALITKDKKNPRSDLRVKTKSAVAGIRGTDFYVSFHGSDGTQLKVMRGKVALKPILKVVKEAPAKVKKMREADPSKPDEENITSQEVVEEVEGKEVEVGTGSSVVVKTFETKEEAQDQVKSMQNTKLEVVKSKEIESVPVAITMAPITKEELLKVQSISVVKQKPTPQGKKAEDSATTITQAETKELEVLEKKATQALVKDITNYTPEIMDKIKDTDKSDSEKINTAVLSNLYKQAPAEKPKSKPTKGDIDSIGQDIYDTYFNIED